MPKLHCGHDAAPSSTRLCGHLFGVASVVNIRFLSGMKLEYDLYCRECAARAKDGEKTEVFTACQACVDAVYDADDDFEWFGAPEIAEQLVPFDATLFGRQIPVENEAVLAVAEDGRVFEFFDGVLSEIGEEKRFLMRLAWPVEPEPDWGKIRLVRRLIISKATRFMALINDFGRYGIIVDLEKRASALHLDRGDYHPEQTPFPAAFFESEGRTLLVHGTAWNRLDISDPQTGDLLSVRESTACENKKRPPHYLDYFHGRLRVSPGGKWILDDGWEWGPAGIPTWWSLDKWLKENVWESEDGPSRQHHIHWAYRWNVPMTWLDEGRLAVSGIGSDDEAMLAGARIFALDGKELFAFAGPSGEFFSDGERLFSVEDDGLQIWDVETGARTGTIAGFCPQFQIEGALIEITGRMLRRWNYDSTKS